MKRLFVLSKFIDVSDIDPVKCYDQYWLVSYDKLEIVDSNTILRVIDTKNNSSFEIVAHEIDIKYSIIIDETRYIVIGVFEGDDKCINDFVNVLNILKRMQ